MSADKKNGYYELFKNNQAEQPFHFTLKAPNHEVILVSETYTTSQAARNGIDSVRLNGSDEANFERKTSKANEPYFVLKAKNGEPIGTSEMYSSESARDHGIKAVMKYCEKAILIDHTVSDDQGGAITSKPQRSQSNQYA
ncbi:MAG: YegP family protein [Bacteroidales bacterium]|nr:YegP family protein [Bacteroidales bacterium]